MLLERLIMGLNIATYITITTHISGMSIQIMGGTTNTSQKVLRQ